MNTSKRFVESCLRLHQRSTRGVLLVLALAGLASGSASAGTHDGREIPEWSNSTMVLPDLASGTELYRVELRLASANPVVLQVADLRPVQGAAHDNVHDHAARYENNVLTIPVFESNGLYYAAELTLQPSATASVQSFLLTDIWQVLPGKLSVPVGGLDYASGSKSAATDSGGRFYAVAGQPIAFSVGALPMSQTLTGVPSSETPWASLFPKGEKDPAYLPSLRILGLMDSDSNSVNGIQISAATKKSVAPSLIGMSLTAADFDSRYSLLSAVVRLADADAVAYKTEAAEINFQKLEIQSYMIDRLEEKSIPGVTLSIELPNGEMWHTAAGVANTATGEAMTTQHKFRVGSATKSFTAMLVMQLVDEGLLSLDQKLDEFFPGMFPGGDIITIKMLLNHTAGIFSFTNEFPGFEEAFGVTMDVPPPVQDLWFVRYIGTPEFIYEYGALADIGAAVNSSFAKNNATASRPWLVNEPGKAWNYSNTHYLLLQEIAERLTNNRWEDEIRRRFVGPLGLKNTVVPSAGDLLLTGTYAHGYVNWADNQGQEVADLFGLPNADIDRSNTDPSYTMGSGAIISTAADLAKWANAVMEGKLLSPETQALMREPFEVAAAFGEEINMLQGVVQDLNLKVFGHRGQIVGYDASWQYHYRDPNDVIGTGTAMAVLLNRTLLTEYNADGSPHISDVNEVMLAGILDILYGAE